MAVDQIRRIKTIKEFHRIREVPGAVHPLISLVDYSLVKNSAANNNTSWAYDFYMIALKKNHGCKIRYGQQHYDFDEGTMFFIAPGQTLTIATNQDAPDKSGWMLLIHPDFLWNTPLAKSIKNYEYFGYSVHEALFLSEQEEAIMSNIVQTIRQEYHTNTDQFSQQIIASQVEVLLNYSDRFYHRQFLTRKMANHQVLEKLEALLEDYFNGKAIQNGLPTVNAIAKALNLSPDYLSSLLKVTTGLNTQQHIHEKLIAKAKEKLAGTHLSVSEIAYELGFEHPQSFSKFFKTKTSISPLAFRTPFN